MSNPDETATITFRPRAAEPVTLSIPVDTLEEIRRIAAQRDMSPEALLKFYIGQGLRQDTSRLFTGRARRTTSEVPGGAD